MATNDRAAVAGLGADVITTVGYMYPAAHGPQLVARSESACGASGPSFHGTGANPGWFGDVRPLVMSELSLRIEADHGAGDPSPSPTTGTATSSVPRPLMPSTPSRTWPPPSPGS